LHLGGLAWRVAFQRRELGAAVSIGKRLVDVELTERNAAQRRDAPLLRSASGLVVMR
jgi:hypothetical protein